MVDIIEAKNGFRGVHYGGVFCHFVVYTMEEYFGIFVVYTMEGNFRSSWCTPWKLKMVFVVYTIEEDFGISWCTPWRGILEFHGVHHGRGF